jgi:hypothetical protein
LFLWFAAPYFWANFCSPLQNWTAFVLSGRCRGRDWLWIHRRSATVCEYRSLLFWLVIRSNLSFGLPLPWLCLWGARFLSRTVRSQAG